MTDNLGVTFFVIPKAFEGKIAVAQENALESWTRLKPAPEIILFCDDDGVAEAADLYECQHVPDLRRNEWGTPVVQDAFLKGYELATHDVVCYVNADIILMQDFMDSLQVVAKRFEQFLMVSTRWDWRKPVKWEFSRHWQALLKMKAREEGAYHNDCGIDYFAHRRGLYQDMPPFAIRTAWDNWLVICAIVRKKVPVVNATRSAFIIHQNHPEKTVRSERRKWIKDTDPERRRNLELASDLVKQGPPKDAPRGCAGSATWALTTDLELKHRLRLNEKGRMVRP